MSIVLVTFPAAPKVSQEAVQKELELENILEKKIRCEYHERIELVLFQFLPRMLSHFRFLCLILWHFA